MRTDVSVPDDVPAEEGLHASNRARAARYFIVVGLLATFLSLSLVLGFRTLRAFSFLYAMSPPPLHLKFIKAASYEIFRHSPVRTEFAIEGRRGPLQIRMLTPRDLPNAPIIVLVHGFALDGFRDFLLNNFAEALGRSGLRVVIPNIPSEERLRMDPAAVDEVDDVIRWTAAKSGQKVSVFGISYSGGMVITAAAQPAYANDVKMVLCVSGYNSIDRLGRYYLHDDVRAPDGQAYPVNTLPMLLSPMALQYLDELVPQEEIAPLSGPLQKIARMEISVDRASADLKEKERVLLYDLLNVRTPEMRERYHALLRRHRKELAYISPEGKIQQVRGSLYVLHGYVDPVIPRGEAEWSEAEAARQKNVHIVITPWMHHGFMNGPDPLLERLRVTYFTYEMLNDAFRYEPLQNVKR